jgi:hypothetical protein
VGISAIDAAGNENYDGLGLNVSDGLKILSGANTYFTVLSGTGNVGLRTTIPDQKLTVKGKIHAEEIKVDLSVPGPDYVFELDYKLSSLDELKKYLDKCLPEIPSAKQMEKDGIDLGDMNVKLLKKVEELTLYAIDQQKQNDQQNARIAALKSTRKADK